MCGTVASTLDARGKISSSAGAHGLQGLGATLLDICSYMHGIDVQGGGGGGSSPASGHGQQPVTHAPCRSQTGYPQSQGHDDA